MIAICLAVLPPLLAPSADARKPRTFNDIPDRLFAANPDKKSMPDAPPTNRLVRPPSENPYYQLRFDDQPYYLMQDITVNYTEILNSFYLDPAWRGEIWAPYEQFSIVEKGSRLMPTYLEYDEFSEARICNRWHKFWERASGYGP
jgi:hypothetical protein